MPPTDPSVIPQPKPRPILGNVPDIGTESPVQGLMKLAQEYGPIFRITMPGSTMTVLAGHDVAADACDESRFEKWIHGPLVPIRDFAGDGLFTAYPNESNWGKAHRLLMPAFGPATMRDYFDDMLDMADQMLTKWERFGPDAPIDVAADMTRLTLDTIALSGFGYRFNSFYQREMHPFVEAMVRALAEAGSRTKRPDFLTKLMPLSARQYDADLALMREVSQDLIAARRRLPPDETPRDLLSLMLTAKDSVTGEGLDDQNIEYQMLTFLIAGHETTSALLSFATYELLKNPDVLERAREIVDRVLGDEMPRFEHLRDLGYLDQILKETLRLYPTAPAFGVNAKEDTLLAERYPVSKDDKFLVLLPSLHRDPTVWNDPERFDPERFLPENQSRIPTHAWKPFGNGERACIGRAFALQEATLVLAMMLQRFEIQEAAPYDLVIKETLSLKPEGLRIRARVRRRVRHTSTTRTAPTLTATSLQPEALGADAHGTRLLLLYGSNSGASEAFARRVAADGAGRGYATKVAPLDDYTGKLPTDGAVVIISASYNGRPPDNARRFHQWLSGAPDASLVGVRYTVFGCGNRDWDSTYQAVPTFIDQRLHEAGAQAFMPRGEADARGDFFGDFDLWYGPFWENLGEALGVENKTLSTGPLYDVTVLSSADAELVERGGLSLATVLENRELVDMTSPLARSKRHLDLALPAGMTYAAGDYLAVLPQNHPDLIARAAKRFGLALDAALLLKSTRGAMAASLPTDRPVSLQEILGRHVELSQPATRNDLAFLAEKNICPPHKAHLAALAADPERYKAEILDKRVSVLDLLEAYPSSVLTFAEFLELLPAMRVRQYSISSSPRGSATQCSLTVAVIDAPAWSGQGRFHGTASSFLGRLSPGDTLPVTVKSPHNPFHPPASNATPMVMIAAGTGLAPFRGFLQERAARRDKGEAVGETLLFFGCDHADVDFLYKDELLAWQDEGLVSVLPAFYHQPDGDVTFVQHRLWAERERVQALWDAGATFFVCGDGRRMAPAVRETLQRIHQETTGVGEADAKQWLERMEQEGRFVTDVFA